MKNLKRLFFVRNKYKRLQKVAINYNNRRLRLLKAKYLKKVKIRVKFYALRTLKFLRKAKHLSFKLYLKKFNTVKKKLMSLKKFRLILSNNESFVRKYSRRRNLYKQIRIYKKLKKKANLLTIKRRKSKNIFFITKKY